MNMRRNSGSFKKGHGLKNIAGKRFGRLSVIRQAGVNKHSSAMWDCICDCGKKGRFKGINLISGHTKSCGCWRKDHSPGRKHGHASREGASPEYTAWKNMINRCVKPCHTSYKFYGKRGIKVCNKWEHFQDFLADVGLRPSNQHSLHRLDNKLGYFPANVIWATREVQDNHRTNNVNLKFDGRTQTLMQWSREVGIKFSTLYFRLSNGWSVRDLLTTPVKSNG